MSDPINDQNKYLLDFSNSLAAWAARSKADESNLYASPLDDEGGGDGFLSEILLISSKLGGSGLLPPIPKIHDIITEKPNILYFQKNLVQ